MVKLYTSGSYFGLPDPSPFVVKAMILFKLAGIPYETAVMSFREAPKGKVPYLRDGQLLLGDSHFIRRHLESHHHADFDTGLDETTRAIHWSLTRMLEEHFYFLFVYERWMVDQNFNNGPREFFKMAPAPIRPFVRWLIRGKVRKSLWSQGLGRHTDAERLELAKGDINAVSTLLADRPFLGGKTPSGADATAFPFLWSACAAKVSTDIGAAIRADDRIMAYLERCRARFFPEFAI